MFAVRRMEMDDVPVAEQIGRRLHPRTAFRDMRYDTATFTRTLMTVVALPQRFFGEVITHHGQVIGFMIAETTESWFGPDRWSRDFLLAIEPNYKGRVGRQLIQLTRDYRAWADALGSKKKYLAVGTEIDAADTAKIFERLGFPQVGTYHCAA